MRRRRRSVRDLLKKGRPHAARKLREYGWPRDRIMRILNLSPYALDEVLSGRGMPGAGHKPMGDA